PGIPRSRSRRRWATRGRPGHPARVVRPAGGGHSVEARELRAHVAAQLPAHMVPSAVVVLDEIPLTPVGKLDRRALPTPEFTSLTTEFRPPSTATERAVTEVFADVLGVDHVGIDDSFFDLGGNSIIATRIMSELQARLGRQLPLQTMFLDPTPSGLAKRIDLPVDTWDAAIPRSTTPWCGDPAAPQRRTTTAVLHPSRHRPVLGLRRPRAVPREGPSGVRSAIAVAERRSGLRVGAAARAPVRRGDPDGAAARPYHLLGWSLGV
ncbi:hypothetical protein GS444_23290, partial [Rhodococcus hoagii]|nr:hypothetical protein [Prescottella equi]